MSSSLFVSDKIIDFLNDSVLNNNYNGHIFHVESFKSGDPFLVFIFYWSMLPRLEDLQINLDKLREIGGGVCEINCYWKLFARWLSFTSIKIST